MTEQETQKAVSMQKTQQAASKAYSQNQRDEDALDKLVKFGGFNFLEATVDGTQNLNPDRKARKKIFLTDNQKKQERKKLKNKIDIWLSVLSSGKTAGEILEECQAKSESVGELLRQNQLKAAERVRDLERAYREVMLFYRNTEEDKLRNISIMNASAGQVADLDNPVFIDAVATELKQNFDRLDLRTNYSILVVPGYMGSNKVVEKWAKIAYDNKVMLFTDFADLDKPDDVVDMFFSSNLTGADAFRSNAVMSCNWLVGRGKYAAIGENEDLHVAPSAALAGKVYATLMSQVTAGKKFGGINEVDSVVFQLKKSEISELERM